MTTTITTIEGGSTFNGGARCQDVCNQLFPRLIKPSSTTPTKTPRKKSPSSSSALSATPTKKPKTPPSSTLSTTPPTKKLKSSPSSTLPPTTTTGAKPLKAAGPEESMALYELRRAMNKVQGVLNDKSRVVKEIQDLRVVISSNEKKLLVVDKTNILRSYEPVIIKTAKEHAVVANAKIKFVAAGDLAPVEKAKLQNIIQQCKLKIDNLP